MATEQRYWFPAKAHGWGWGFPTTWQGRVVLSVYVILVFGGIPVLEPRAHPLPYVLYVVALSLVLTVVCWRTGEPPRWRWGRE